MLISPIDLRSGQKRGITWSNCMQNAETRGRSQLTRSTQQNTRHHRLRNRWLPPGRISEWKRGKLEPGGKAGPNGGEKLIALEGRLLGKGGKARLAPFTGVCSGWLEESLCTLPACRKVERRFYVLLAEAGRRARSSSGKFEGTRVGQGMERREPVGPGEYPTLVEGVVTGRS